MNPVDEEAPVRLPASAAQTAFAVAHELDPTGARLTVAWGYEPPGGLDAAALARALDLVVARHEAMRTSLTPDGRGGWTQTVAASVTARPELVDLTGWPLAEQDRRRAEVRARAAAEPFDLSRPPLLRVTLIRLGAGWDELLLRTHHAVVDATALLVVLQELLSAHDAYRAGTPVELDEPALQYPDVSEWERETSTGPAWERGRAFWTGLLSGRPAVLNLPPAVNAGSRRPLGLPADLCDRLRTAAGAWRCSPFAIVLAALGVVLGRHAESPAVLIATPVSRRDRPELAEVVGPLVDTMVLPVDTGGDPSFAGLAGAVGGTVLAALEHRAIPLDTVIADLRPDRAPGRTPLAQVLLAVHQDLGLSIERLPTGTAYDLAFTVDLDDPPRSYVEHRLSAEQVDALAEHLRAVLDAGLAAPDRPVRTLPMHASPAAAAARWRGRTVPRPQTGLAGLFEAQARRTPDAVAVVAGRRHLTYRALDRAADAVALRLLRDGSAVEEPVGVCGPRGPEFAVAVLGVLKAGGAVVPVDGSAPRERRRALLAGAGVRRALADPDLLAGDADLTVWPLTALAGAAPAGKDWPPGPRVHPDQLAFVLHTSGSTGRPKGVLLPHRAVVNYVLWCADEYGLGPGDAAPLHGAIDFDTTVISSLLPPLLTGGKVVVPPAGTVIEATAALPALGVDFAYVALTPSQLEVLAAQPHADRPGWARLIVVGGEALAREVAEPWRGRGRLLNDYGPTETVAACSAYEVPARGPLPPILPIGQPIDNCDMLVRTDAGVLAAVGVAGELYVGGDGVGHGYLGRPAETAAHFGPDPYARVPGRRAYRTGDVARRRPDGELEFLGRRDDQVKVRGHRVEPGEVESAILSHPEVRGCAVLPRGEGAARTLVAYVVTAAGRPPADPLPAYLAQRLPAPLVPTSYAMLAALPTLPNGKTDRRALAAVPSGPPERAATGAAPRTAEEILLAEFWADVLGTAPAGVRDDFFAAGGHSVAAAQLLALVQTRLGLVVPLARFFAAATVAGLAEAIAAAKAGESAAPIPAAAADPDAVDPVDAVGQLLDLLDPPADGGPQ